MLEFEPCSWLLACKYSNVKSYKWIQFVIDSVTSTQRIIYIVNCLRIIGLPNHLSWSQRAAYFCNTRSYAKSVLPSSLRASTRCLSEQYTNVESVTLHNPCVYRHLWIPFSEVGKFLLTQNNFDIRSYMYSKTSNLRLHSDFRRRAQWFWCRAQLFKT